MLVLSNSLYTCLIEFNLNFIIDIVLTKWWKGLISSREESVLAMNPLILSHWFCSSIGGIKLTVKSIWLFSQPQLYTWTRVVGNILVSNSCLVRIGYLSLCQTESIVGMKHLTRGFSATRSIWMAQSCINALTSDPTIHHPTMHIYAF